MGNTYGPCGGCGGIPVPVPYPVGTGIYAPPPLVATRVLTPPIYSSPLIDADPITPGIQTRPGVVTPVGPPRVVGGGYPGPIIGGPVIGGPRFGISRVGAIPDLDPITPGFQTRPGVVTATGPSLIRPF